ncbi:MAG: CHASE3 domain-containing protein [Rhizorhabdus sp.]|uniref:CHASE3 domain-containing protein n=1 Tax=Rhizorhabdus sp. TaxID=1968843 RepID=UPI001B4EF4EC|nr:CHASE3 domain-containing protein [Rhizorhabdus sp.]MBP8233794.1 CHASE3 domain-containing protein [Rhizorhabdus sp.]
MTRIRARRSNVKPSWLSIAMVAAIAPLTLAGFSLWIENEARHDIHTRLAIYRTQAYQHQLVELTSLLKDAESAQRGYLITGDRAFLQPYLEARARTPERVASVRRLTSSPQDAADLAELLRLNAAKWNEMRRTLEIRDGGNPAGAIERLRAGEGQRLMDEIRAVVDRMTTRAGAGLARGMRAEEHRFEEIRLQVFASILITSLIAGSVGIWIGRDRRMRHLLNRERADIAARQRAIFESATDAIILINPSGSIETINPAAERMFLYNAAELLRRDIATLIDIAPGEGSFLSRLGVRDGRLAKTELIDVTGRTSAGELITLDVVLGTMELPDGVHIVAALRDATRRKEVDQLKDDFISTVSHELRTPLTSIVGSLGLLRSGAAGALPGDAQRLAEIAETNSQRLIRLINDILDIDQIRKGRMAFDYAVIDLRDVMQKAVESMQGLAQRRSVTIECAAPPHPVMACADQDRLVQVAGNLLSNALKFSPEGSTIRFELFPGEEDHVIQVTDNGPGIAADFAGSIFNRFARADRPANRKVGGTGLGLAISREIVRSHGGDISFENRAQGGAIFAFSIPRDTASLTESDNAVRLLVCEQEPQHGRSIQSMLNAQGYASDFVMTVRDGIAHARSQPYEAVILNPAMGDVEGIDAVRRFGLARNRAGQPTPIIVVSDRVPPSDGSDRFLAGWLQRPVDPRTMVQIVQRAIRRADHRKAVILHVVDDDDTRELFSAALAGRGLLLNATSLRSAEKILAERLPDAIVLDLGLPDGSGKRLLTDVKRWKRPLPIIVYSAQEIDEETRRLADAVIVKSRRALSRLATTVLDIVDRHGGPQ